MSTNTRIRNFDINLVNYINEEIANGLPISAVVLSLDKCLSYAKLSENQAIEDERVEAEALAKQEYERRMMETANIFDPIAETASENVESVEADITEDPEVKEE